MIENNESITSDTGKFIIGDQEFTGSISDYNFDDYAEDVDAYVKDNTVYKLKDDWSGFTCTIKVDRINWHKVSGIYDWVLENCPNRKLKHLIKYGSTKRVRLKNYYRVVRLIGRTLTLKENKDD